VPQMKRCDMTSISDEESRDVRYQVCEIKRCYMQSLSDEENSGFQSYLLGRTQYVQRGILKSSIVRLTCGVPQG